MKKAFQRFRDSGAQIVVIAPHDEKKVRDYWGKESLPFIGIPDLLGGLGRLYAQEWRLFRLGRMPALFVVDANGIVVFAHYADHMAHIPGNAALLQALDGLRTGR